jgi:hypothetical protein
MSELALKGVEGLRRNMNGLKSVWFLSAAIALVVLVLDSGNFENFLKVAATALAGTLP